MKLICENEKSVLQKELVLYPDKTGKVCDLLDEAKKQLQLTDSGKMRYIYPSLFMILSFYIPLTEGYNWGCNLPMYSV